MAAAGFHSHYQNGPLPYVWRHITVDKMCWVRRWIKHFSLSLFHIECSVEWSVSLILNVVLNEVFVFVAVCWRPDVCLLHCSGGRHVWAADQLHRVTRAGLPLSVWRAHQRGREDMYITPVVVSTRLLIKAETICTLHLWLCPRGS